MATTGALMVFLRLPSDSAGASLALASADFTNTIRAGVVLASVGPNFSNS